MNNDHLFSKSFTEKLLSKAGSSIEQFDIKADDDNQIILIYSQHRKPFERRLTRITLDTQGETTKRDRYCQESEDELKKFIDLILQE